MKLGKTILAGTLAAVMATATGCASSPGWVYENEAGRVGAGTYLFQMVASYYDAYAELQPSAEEQEVGVTGPITKDEVLAGTIDGLSASDWILRETEKDAMRYLGAERKFAELGLEVDFSDQYNAQYMAEQYWGYLGSILEQNSVAFSSVSELYLNDTKKDKIFDELYKEGGQYAGDEAANQQEFYATYGKADYMSFLKGNPDEEAGETQEQLNADLKKTVEEYKTRMEAGEAVEDLVYAYNLDTAPDEEAKESVTRPDDGSRTIIVSENSAAYSEDLVQAILAGNPGNIVIVEDTYYFYLVKVQDLTANPQDYEENRSEFLRYKYNDTFREMLEEWGRDGAVENKGELRKYKPKKLDMEWNTSFF